MIDDILSILTEICGADEGELAPDTALFDEGILDSFGLVQLLVELENQLDVRLDPAALDRAQFATPAKIAALAEAEKG